MIHGLRHGGISHPKRPPKLVAFLGKITRGFAIDMLKKKSMRQNGWICILQT